MFNTIKSKIVLIAVFMLITLSVLLCVFTFFYMKTGKSLILTGTTHSISVFAKNINKEVVRIEDNAKDLDLHGALFYKIDKNKKIAEDTIISVFNNYEHSLGGGIWFKPYSIDKNKRLYCIYVYRNKANEVVPDNNFETEDYNYPEKSWYKDIMPELEEGDKIAWSLPYYEKEGSNTLMVTAGSGIYFQNKLVGLSTVDWELDSIIDSVSKIKPTPNSFALFADKEHDYIIASSDPYLNNKELVGKSLKYLSWYNENLKQITYMDYHGKRYVPYVKTLDNGLILIVNIPKHELFSILYKHVLLLFIGLMGICFAISVFLYLILVRSVNRPINKLTDIANQIREGDLDVKIKLDKPEEFAKLADTFNDMCVNIKNITGEREKIEAELSLAKDIQASSLPNVFPPFPENNQFDIYAGMEPAKEVGGDFYDFYFIDENKFMFLIADVSGKGVPAALFMMTVKTLINYVSQSVHKPDDMIKMVNQKICANNKQGFFVTLLAGIVDITNGEITFINCGHNPPLIKNNDGKFRYLELDSNIVLGAFNNAEFKTSSLKLEPGDTVILYTDGVTEAMNSEEKLYGEDRLLNVANSIEYNNLAELQNGIKADVKTYTEGFPQSDDMTMLVYRYNGNNKETYCEIASKENYKNYLAWLSNVSEKYELTSDIRYKLELISEEIYTNIFSYAYSGNEGKIEVNIEKTANEITIGFSDWGVPFNPLDKPDPDVDFPPENRDAGGLGIFIVKNMVNDINYQYSNSKNILTMKIKI